MAKSDTEKRELPQIGPRITQEAIDKLKRLAKQVRPLGHPRAVEADVVGALIDAATPQSAAEALTGYNPKLGQALQGLEELPQ